MWKAFIYKIQRFVRHNENERLRDVDVCKIHEISQITKHS